MARASKRAKTAATSTVTTNDANSTSVSDSAQPQLRIPFQTGPTLERIPDDVLHEILSCLPTLIDAHALFAHRLHPPVIPSSSLIRTPTLRALSRTSRLLRSRCLAMAWQRLELCGASLPKYNVTFYKAVGEATKAAVGVLNACPHLWPLIQTVSVVLTRFQSAEIIPEFAACLAKLSNLTTIEVIHAHTQMTTAIKNGFEGKKFPSVRKITLPSSAHEIIKSCPNLEQVTCTDGDGSTIVGSLVKGKCHQLCVLKDVRAPLTRLVKVAPNLRYISVRANTDLKPRTIFPLLDTIEIFRYCGPGEYETVSPSEAAASDVKEASKILQENKSQAEKTVIVTLWRNVWYDPQEFDPEKAYATREVIKV